MHGQLDHPCHLRSKHIQATKTREIKDRDQTNKQTNKKSVFFHNTNIWTELCVPFKSSRFHLKIFSKLNKIRFFIFYLLISKEAFAFDLCRFSGCYILWLDGVKSAHLPTHVGAFNPIHLLVNNYITPENPIKWLLSQDGKIKGKNSSLKINKTKVGKVFDKFDIIINYLGLIYFKFNYYLEYFIYPSITLLFSILSFRDYFILNLKKILNMRSQTWKQKGSSKIRNLFIYLFIYSWAGKWYNTSSSCCMGQP